MSKILVTGITGVVGKGTIEHLLKKGIPASEIIGLSRKEGALTDLVTRGVQVRLGDYYD
jgi:NAD(P)H dehydrogenase (quinone)